MKVPLIWLHSPEQGEREGESNCDTVRSKRWIRNIDPLWWSSSQELVCGFLKRIEFFT